MTLKRADVTLTTYLMGIWKHNSPENAGPRLRVQPWLKLLAGCACLLLGLRLFSESLPLVSLLGFALLLRFPSYCYFSWCDYRDRNAARHSLTLDEYLASFSLNPARQAATLSARCAARGDSLLDLTEKGASYSQYGRACV
jgi:hypothetical protein